MRIALLAALLALSGVEGLPQEKPLKIVMVAQDSPTHYDAQLLGDLDRPAGDGVVIGAERRETKVDEKGRLEIDVKGDGKFRALSGKREIVTFALQGDGDKPKSINAKFEFRKNEKGDWV